MPIYWNQTTLTCADNEDVPSAMRIALVNCGTVSAKAEAEEILSVKPSNNSGNAAVMYEPNSRHHTEASGYADGTTAPDTYVKTAFTPREPMGGNGDNIYSNSSYTAASAATRASDVAPTNAWFSAKTGINRVRVYLWMEGNDVDCANDVAGSTINFNLVLSMYQS